MPDLPSLGRRGGGWVALQFALMAMIVVASVRAPSWPDSLSAALAVVGAVAAVAGGVLAIAAARALGSALTPFPHPADSGQLVERGPYRIVRHPIYSAGSLFFAGLSLAFSPAALALTAALVLTWALKSVVEERFLLASYAAYAAYQERVPYRLVPYLY